MVDIVFHETYGNDKNNKPNDHCFWCVWHDSWMEDDEHFMIRIKERQLEALNHQAHNDQWTKVE